MSINTSAIRKAGPYTCNGSTTVYPFSFKVFQASDVLVVQTSSAAVETILALNVDYTVALNANQDSNPGGSITTTATWATGNLITIGSQVASTQSVTLTNTGGFYPQVLNDALDRVTILVQQLQEIGTRTVTVPISSTTTPQQGYTNIITYANNASVAASNAAASQTAAAASASAASSSQTAAAASASSASASASSASASQSAAATSATNAASSASSAASWQSLAQTNDTNAAASAASASNSAATALGAIAPVTSTSSSSITVASSGNISFTTQTGKGYVPGHPIKIAETSNAAVNYITGTCTSYNSGTGAMVVAAAASGGAGTYTDWTISVTTQSGAGVPWASVTGTPTTIAGYGITNLFTLCPTLTGGGASGTWAISISGNAATATSATTATTGTNWGSYGAVPTAGAVPGANGIPRADASGYMNFNYVNINTATGENPTVGNFIVTNNSDNNYLRKASPSWAAAAIQAAASGSWGINITGSSASCTGNAATATTATSAGTATSASNLTGASPALGSNWSIDGNGQLSNNGNTIQSAYYRLSATQTSGTVVNFAGIGSQNGSNFSVSSGTVTVAAAGWYRCEAMLAGGCATTQAQNLFFGGTNCTIYGPTSSNPYINSYQSAANNDSCTIVAVIHTTAANATINVQSGTAFGSGGFTMGAGSGLIITRIG